jgi:hypothetical protein
MDAHEKGIGGQVDLWAQKLGKTQSQNNQLHDAYLDNLNTLETTMHQSYSTMSEQLGTVVESAGKFQNDMSLHSDTLKQPIATLENDICEPLSRLRASIRGCSLPTTASLRQPDYTTIFPRQDVLHYQVSSRGKDSPEVPSKSPMDQSNAEDSAPLTSSVNKRPREQDFSDRPEATRSEQERTPYGIPENRVAQPCLEVASDSHQTRLKRRRL